MSRKTSKNINNRIYLIRYFFGYKEVFCRFANITQYRWEGEVEK